jgi:Domain of unknown function (DUF4407)
MGAYARIAIIGGADPRSPLDPDNRVRHLAVGMLIVAVAAWAFVATTFTFRETVHVPWRMAIVAGFLVATIILAIDLALTSTPLKSDSWSARVQVIALRGMVSVAMGLVVSHATILLMYGSSLSQIVAAHNQQLVRSDSATIRAASPYPSEIAAAQHQTTADNNQIAVADSILAADSAALERRKQDWLNDQLCTRGTRASNGDVCGAGSVARELKRSYNAYLTTVFPQAQRIHDTAVATLRADVVRQKSIVATDTTALNNQLKQGVAADLKNTGLIARTNALWSLLQHDWFAWLWVVFFIVIDIAVGFLKGVLPESDFDRRRREGRALEASLASRSASDPAWAGVVSHKAQRDAQVALARIDAESDRELERIARRDHTQPGPSSTRVLRPRWLAAGAVAVVAMALLFAPRSSHPTSPRASRPVPLHSVAARAHPRAVVPVDFRLAAPVSRTRLATLSFLKRDGRVVMQLHTAAAALDTKFSSPECHVGQRLVNARTRQRVAEIPDQILRELAIDEFHEIAVQGKCMAEQDQKRLHRVVGVTTERLGQIGAVT